MAVFSAYRIVRRKPLSIMAQVPTEWRFNISRESVKTDNLDRVVAFWANGLLHFLDPQVRLMPGPLTARPRLELATRY